MSPPKVRYLGLKGSRQRASSAAFRRSFIITRGYSHPKAALPEDEPNQLQAGGLDE